MDRPRSRVPRKELARLPPRPGQHRLRRRHQVTAATVARLSKAWSTSGVTGVSGTPAVIDGVAYFGDWKGQMWAVSAASRRGDLDHPDGRRGVIVAPGRLGNALYIGGGHTLFRLDKRHRRHRVEGEHERHALSPDQRLARSTSAVSSCRPRRDPGRRARPDQQLPGIDRRLRRRQPARRCGASTPPPPTPTRGSGVGIWSTPAVDPGRGLLYVGTGNTSSEPTAPLADALLAIDYRTGEAGVVEAVHAPDVFAKATPRARTPTSVPRPTCGRPTVVTSSASATRAATTTRSTERRARSCGRPA